MEFNLYEEIENYRPIDEIDKLCLEKTKKFLQENDNCFSRTNLKGHITGSALVMNTDGNVLLNHHKSLDRWLYFGGHSDGEENSLNVAKREVSEECGISDFNDLGGKILDIDVQIVPDNKVKKEPEHYHYDIRFLFITNNSNFTVSDESIEIRWVSLKQAKELIKNNTGLLRALGKAEEIMNNIELVDIYDENKNKTSKTKIRNKDVFEKGEYLIGVGAIIINSKKQILISQRSALKKVLPLKWECNGGALLSGEDDFIKGLIREIHEELGIKLSKKEAIHLKTVKKEHEFKEIYLFKKDIKLEDIKFTDGETINAKWVDIDEFIKMFNNGEIVYNVDFNNDDYIRSLELLGL